MKFCEIETSDKCLKASVIYYKQAVLTLLAEFTTTVTSESECVQKCRNCLVLYHFECHSGMYWPQVLILFDLLFDIFPAVFILANYV